MASPSASPRTLAPLTRPLGRTRDQALATAVAGAAAFVVGSLTAVASLGGLPWQSLVSLVTSPQLLLWVGGIAVLALVWRRGRAVPFAVVAVVLAPVATVVEALLRGGAAQFVSYPYLMIMTAWQSLGLVGAALVGAIAGVLHRRSREVKAARDASDAPAPADRLDGVRVETPDAPDARSDEDESAPTSRGGVLAGVSIALLVIGSALAFVLPLQWFSVYFRLGGDAAVATPAQGARYLWTAGLALAFLVGALAVAIVRRRTGLIVLASLAAGCALVGAFVFQVPQGRFWPEPAAPAYNDDFPVCYGTTGDCPGG